MTATSCASLWMTSPPCWTSILVVLDGPVVGAGEWKGVQLIAQKDPSLSWRRYVLDLLVVLLQWRHIDAFWSWCILWKNITWYTVVHLKYLFACINAFMTCKAKKDILIMYYTRILGTDIIQCFQCLLPGGRAGSWSRWPRRLPRTISRKITEFMSLHLLWEILVALSPWQKKTCFCCL